MAQVKDGLQRIRQGLFHLMPEDDVVTALLTGGSRRQKIQVSKSLSLGRILDGYAQSIPTSAIEETTLGMLDIHCKHLKRLIGTRIQSSCLTLNTIQDYINSRCLEKGIRGRTLSPVTVAKEITTLYAACSWAHDSKLVSLALPRKSRLRYPKKKQKPPFKTWSEIERVIKRGSLTENQQKDYWDCLYLNETQITELIKDIYTSSVPLAIKTMFAVAAYTGVRRSEMLRSQVEDFDFENNIMTVREKKRVRSQHTTRTVPICEALRKLLLKWFSKYNNASSFVVDNQPISVNQARHYFESAVSGFHWKVLNGWHVLRHSFVSNAASKGVDQRLISEWVGHETHEMQARYRHLFPDVQKAAIEKVFSSEQRAK